MLSDEETNSLLNYNVFDLDATGERTEKGLAYLMMCICMKSASSKYFGPRNITLGAHI
jgi:hypothetical protein